MDEPARREVSLRDGAADLPDALLLDPPDDSGERRQRLTLRLYGMVLLAVTGVTLTRVERGPAYVASSLAFMLLVAAAAVVTRRVRASLVPMQVAVLLAFNAACAYWLWEWTSTREGLPPVVGLGISTGLVLGLLSGPRTSWLALGLHLVRLVAAAQLAHGVAARQWDLFSNTVLTLACLQATAWAFDRIHRTTAGQVEEQTRRLRVQAEQRSRLVSALLDDLEAPLVDPGPAGPVASRSQADRLIRGLGRARAVRDAMPFAEGEVPDLDTSRRLLAPLLALGILAALGTSAQGFFFHAPNAWIGLPASVVLTAMMLYAYRRPSAWSVIATTTLAVLVAGIALDVLLVAPGVFPSGLVLGTVGVAFGGLWLGGRAAAVLASILVAVTVGLLAGRAPTLRPEDRMVAVNLIAEWLFMVAIVVPAAAAQHRQLRRLDVQRRGLAASLRVRRRLLGTLFHDAANHVTVLASLADMEEDGAAEPGDAERRERVRSRLTALLASARHWLFIDAPFAPEQLSALPVAALGRGMEDLFRERLAEKGQRLQVELPAGLRVACVPELLSDGVLGNLVSNAVKFSPTGALIELVATPEGGDICIRVSDRGPGVPAATLAELQSGRGDLRSIPGTGGEQGQGLGLLLATEHARRMGGSLALVPRAGGGTEAQLRLSRAQG